jgi:hypothetical protein
MNQREVSKAGNEHERLTAAQDLGASAQSSCIVRRRLQKETGRHATDVRAANAVRVNGSPALGKWNSPDTTMRPVSSPPQSRPAIEATQRCIRLLDRPCGPRCREVALHQPIASTTTGETSTVREPQKLHLDKWHRQAHLRRDQYRHTSSQSVRSVNRVH